MIVHDGAGTHLAQSNRVRISWTPRIKTVSYAILHENDEDVTFVTMSLSEVERLMPELAVAMFELGSTLVTADDGTEDPFEVAVHSLISALRGVAARAYSEDAEHTHEGCEGPVKDCPACAAVLATMRAAAPRRPAEAPAGVGGVFGGGTYDGRHG